MMKSMSVRFTVFLLLVVISVSGYSQINQNIIADKGAWCWFADSRATHYQNASGTICNTYIGYIDAQGNIKATQVDHVQQTVSEVLIRSWFQPDDHNNPTFLVLPDERVMVFYSRHTDEACFYYRVSRKKGDITTLGDEMRLDTDHNTTYPSPFILSDDPNHIYLCWRGIGWHPTIARLTMPDENDRVAFNWGPYQMVRSRKGQGGTRPYAKYASNGKDKIYLAYTTTHPDNQRVNYIYYNGFNVNTRTLSDINGKTLAVVGSGELHDVDATSDYVALHPNAVVDSSPERNWLWELALDSNENPVIATVGISENKQSHNYFHVTWNGREWQKTFLANGGGHFHQTPNIENCYSGGLAIDKTNTAVFYGSVPVNGKYGRVYELKKFTIDSNNGQVAEEQITFDSEKNNVRPYIIDYLPGKNGLAWMHGDYYDWIVSSARPKGYATGIRTNLVLPNEKVDLTKGLIMQRQLGIVPQTQKAKFRTRKSKSFTIAIEVKPNAEAYHGDIVKFAGITYRLPNAQQPKPELLFGDKIFKSTNVLGTSDEWQRQARSTNGKWYPPQKFSSFYLVITYTNGIVRTYINGLLDQSIDIPALKLKDVEVGGFDGEVATVSIYNRALSQIEVKKFEE
jgi:hypothetical protein